MGDYRKVLQKTTFSRPGGTSSPDQIKKIIQMSEIVKLFSNASSLPLINSQEYWRRNTEEQDADNGCSGSILKLIHRPPGWDKAD